MAKKNLTETKEPVAEEPKKRSGKTVRIAVASGASFSSNVLLNGREITYTAVKGVIETDDTDLVAHLTKLHGYKLAE